MTSETRRHFLKTTGALALALGHPRLLPAATNLPIADAHNHIGLFSPKFAGRKLKAEMEESGVLLLSWNIVGDARWTVRTRRDIEQRSVPASGEQASYFRQRLDTVREYLKAHGLGYVQKPADIDA
jgi:hypothetical protein